MWNLLKKVVLFLLVMLTMASCVSLQDRALPAADANQVLGTVEAGFSSFQFLHIQNKNEIKRKAYAKLLEEAKKQYSENVDVKNIVISSSFSGLELINMIAAAGIGVVSGFLFNDVIAIAPGFAIGIGVTGNTQKIYAKGDVVQTSRSAAIGIEGALSKAAGETLKNVPKRSRLAIVYITAQDRSITDYIAGELEYIWVNGGYTITDRSDLDRLRREQNFQLSGEVDDDTAVSIGKFVGADIIVTGKVDGEGNLRRLRLRALNTQTAQVVGVSSERF
jgi:hypothetical protein